MKRFKKLFSLFLALAIVLLNGCSNATLPTTQEQQEGLVEITEMTSKMSGFIDMAMSGDNVVFLTMHDMTTYQLTLYSPKKNKIITEKDLSDVDFDVVSSIEFDDDNRICIVDGGTDKLYVYDLDFNLIETKDNETYDYDKYQELSEFFDGSFGYMDEYALCYDELYDMCVFYDEPNVVYCRENDGSTIIDNYGKTVLNVNYTEDENGGELSVVDYSKGVCINKAKAENKGTGVYVTFSDYDFNDNYVCTVVNYSMENGINSYYAYIWDYTVNPINENINVFTMDKEQIESQSSQYIADVKDSYNINITVDDEPEPVESDYDYYDDTRVIDYNPTDLQVYLLLTKLTKCLEMFPENFFAEMFESADENCDFEIHIVKNISDAGAFASRYGQFSITLATSSYSNTTLCHELMHLIEARLLDYYNDNGQDFYTLWEQYNPTDFWYTESNDYSNYDENYFISTYSTTDIREDFADTFQYLFDAYYETEKPDWMNYDAVNNKAIFLSKSIREAFPSVQNTDQAFWEKYITYNA